MDELNQGAPAAEAAPDIAVETRAQPPAAPPAAPAASAAPAVDAEQIRADERRRAAGILDATRKLGVDEKLAHQLIADGVSLDEARMQLIDARATTQRQSTAGTSRVEVGTDHGEKRQEAMMHALEARCNIRGWDEGGAREYLGFTLLDMARECVERSGVSTRGMSRDELAGRAIHSTTDFPILMASIQRVTLKAAYGEERQTWRPLARQRDLPDFRQMSEIEMGGKMLPQELKEGGEYKAVTMKETSGSWLLSEYGTKLVVGRRLIINDNLGYITRGIANLGRGVAVFEANMMWNLITDGTLGAKCMMDGKALFHADHNNTGTGVIGKAAIKEARKKMRMQKGFDGTELYVDPRYILLPVELETDFDEFNTTIVPNQTSNVPVFNNGYLTKIVEPRLDAKSLTQFYIVGDYPGVDKLLFGYLEGEDGPTIETIPTRDPDGVTVFLRHSFGCTVPQHQGFYRSTGA